MQEPVVVPTASEKKLDPDSFVVSRTDSTGKIIYANRTFMEISGYPERALLGKPHNIIRHPDMPRGMFKYLWDEIRAGREFFMFVKNLCSDGGFYWVFANVSPDFDPVDGHVTGFYSVRRHASEAAISVISEIYREMKRIEEGVGGGRAAPEQSLAYLQEQVARRGVTYERFVLGLYQGEAA